MNYLHKTPYEAGVLHTEKALQKDVDSFMDLLKEIDLARDFENSKSWRTEISSLMSVSFIKKNLPEQKLAFALTDLFGTADPEKIRILLQNFQPTYFRASLKYALKPADSFLWHQSVCLLAQNIFLKYFDWNCEKELLEELKKILQKSNILEKIKEIFENYGIKLIYLLKNDLKLPIDGTVFWLDQNPVVALSLRKKTISDLIFSVFHELGHLFLHLKSDSKAIFVNENADTNLYETEKQANEYAENQLIPRILWNDFVKKGNFLSRNIQKFANELQIPACILERRLKYYQYIPWNRRFPFSEKIY